MDQKILGKWNEIRGEILKKWGELKGSELDKAKGNVVAIVGLLQQRAGVAKNEAEKQINEIVAKYTPKATEKVDEIKAKATAVAGKVNERLETIKGKIKR